jgi:hypothetical protein
MNPHGNDREPRLSAGYALLAALVGIIVVGTLVTLGFNGAFANTTRISAERNAAFDQISLGLERVLADWDISRLASVERDTIFLVEADASGSGRPVAITIERAGSGSFRILATASSTVTDARPAMYCTRTVPALLRDGRLVAAAARQERTCRTL